MDPQHAIDLALAATEARQAAERAQLAGVVALLRTEAHRADHARSPRAWLARHCGVGSETASQWCRAATACERFPVAAEAFWEGSITLGHLDAWSRTIPARLRGEALRHAVDQVNGIATDLVAVARETDVPAFADFCARVRDRLDQDGPGDPIREPSRLTLRRGVGGRWVLQGDLAADDGALLATMLDDLAARRVRAERAAGAEPPPPDERPTPAESRAHDLLAALGAGVASGRPGRVSVHLHVDLDHLMRTSRGRRPSLGSLFADDGRAGGAHTESDLDVSDDTLWALMADADVTPVFTHDGASLSFGRTRRLPPATLRRVLAHRHRRCPVPGCDRPPIWTQAHHIVRWTDGGPTDPANLTAPCHHHHRRHHTGHLRFAADPDRPEHTLVLEPDGTPVDPIPRWRRAPSCQTPPPADSAT